MNARAQASYSVNCPCCSRSASVTAGDTAETQPVAQCAVFFSICCACAVLGVFATETYLHCSCLNDGTVAITDDSPAACFGVVLRRVLMLHQRIISMVVGSLYPIDWAHLSARFWCVAASLASTIMVFFLSVALTTWCLARRKLRAD